MRYRKLCFLLLLFFPVMKFVLEQGKDANFGVEVA